MADICTNYIMATNSIEKEDDMSFICHNLLWLVVIAELIWDMLNRSINDIS